MGFANRPGGSSNDTEIRVKESVMKSTFSKVNLFQKSIFGSGGSHGHLKVNIFKSQHFQKSTFGSGGYVTKIFGLFQKR
jgi:hypothetical protein